MRRGKLTSNKKELLGRQEITLAKAGSHKSDRILGKKSFLLYSLALVESRHLMSPMHALPFGSVVWSGTVTNGYCCWEGGDHTEGSGEHS